MLKKPVSKSHASNQSSPEFEFTPFKTWSGPKSSPFTSNSKLPLATIEVLTSFTSRMPSLSSSISILLATPSPSVSSSRIAVASPVASGVGPKLCVAVISRSSASCGSNSTDHIPSGPTRIGSPISPSALLSCIVANGTPVPLNPEVSAEVMVTGNPSGLPGAGPPSRKSGLPLPLVSTGRRPTDPKAPVLGVASKMSSNPSSSSSLPDATTRGWSNWASMLSEIPPLSLSRSKRLIRPSPSVSASPNISTLIGPSVSPST